MRIFFCVLMLIPVLGVAQDKIITTKVDEQEKTKVKVSNEIVTTRSDSAGIKRFTYWEKQNKVSFDFSQLSFVHWNAGGANSVSGLAAAHFNRNYIRDSYFWKNELIGRYGINNQEGQETRKTDDLIQLNSNFGYRTAENSDWFYSSKFTFTTQFTSGYAYPNTTKPISTFFAPAYLFLGVGAEYALKEKQFTLYLSPLTQKSTFVLDQALADAGAFGVDKAIYDAEGVRIRKGANSRTEIGFFINTQWKNEIFKNIILENRLNLYSDYLNKFGNIDVDWMIKTDFVVNKYVRANILMHLIYDDDIKARKEVNGQSTIIGPRIQLKQILGIGVVYEFK